MTLKKLFLGTTAVLAAGLVGAGARAASPITLTLGGFYGAALDPATSPATSNSVSVGLGTYMTF